MSLWTIFLSIALLTGNSSVLQLADREVDELSILGAVLAEPDPEWMQVPERLVVAPQTELDYAHPWVRSSADRSIKRDGSPDAYLVPEALLDAARSANRSTLSLAGMQMPGRLELRRESCGVAWVLTLSRPGISADLSQAIVGASLDEPTRCDVQGVTVRGARGISYLLERGPDRRWHVVGRGFQWIT